MGGESFPGGSVVKNLPANAENASLIPGLRIFPQEGKATHSSILAWEIPWTEEPGGLQPIRLQRVRHNSDYITTIFTKRYQKHVKNNLNHFEVHQGNYWKSNPCSWMGRLNFQEQ